FCNVKKGNVIQSIDAESIYDVPLLLHEQNFDEVALQTLGLSTENEPQLDRWINFLDKRKNPSDQVEIALIGKYTSLQDSYKSISEAFTHAGAAVDTGVKIRWI